MHFAGIRTSLAGISPDDGTRGCWIMAATVINRILSHLLRIQGQKKPILYPSHLLMKLNPKTWDIFRYLWRRELARIQDSGFETILRGREKLIIHWALFEYNLFRWRLKLYLKRWIVLHSSKVLSLTVLPAAQFMNTTPQQLLLESYN